jgi:periplasmic divalent cation tolerance protein
LTGPSQAEFIEVFTTINSEKKAKEISSKLLAKRLTSCVQIVGPVKSIYWWKGKIQRAREWLCLIKVKAEDYYLVESNLKKMHSYSIPEILGLPILVGNADYLQWIRTETTPRDYHGIIIKQSLRDRSILDNVKILGKKTAKDWTMLRVLVPDDELENFLKLVKANLLTENKVPYYAHFYNREDLIVVFPERIFYVKLDKRTWGPVARYGKSLGVPERELDFKPSRFEDETY